MMILIHEFSHWPALILEYIEKQACLKGNTKCFIISLFREFISKVNNLYCFQCIFKEIVVGLELSYQGKAYLNFMHL